MMLILDYIIRLTIAMATLALFSSIPAAAQSKLSPQQFNPPELIAAPKPPTAYSPNGNKPVPALTVQRPVPIRDMNPRPDSRNKPGAKSELNSVNVQSIVSDQSKLTAGASSIAKKTQQGQNCLPCLRNMK
jgi:hypothetical protein